jgi:hypothetical protein
MTEVSGQDVVSGCWRIAERWLTHRSSSCESLPRNYSQKPTVSDDVKPTLWRRSLQELKQNEVAAVAGGTAQSQSGATVIAVIPPETGTSRVGVTQPICLPAPLLGGAVTL